MKEKQKNQNLDGLKCSPAVDNVSENTTRPPTGYIATHAQMKEVSLARAYIDVSEDPLVGNNQTSTELWKHVRAQFFSAMGRDSYQTNNMISGEWCDLERKVVKFNGVWIQHHNNRKGGENDETVMKEALMTYARENESFSHIVA
ncbi:hypothetical protein R6Q59_033614 [Mikania micrantha]